MTKMETVSGPNSSTSLTSALASIELSASFAGSRTSDLGTDTYVVSITGPRGSGKTTLLREVLVAQELHEKFVVLPVIEPEFFGSHDTVLGHVLATLRRHLFHKHPDVLAKEVQLPPELGVKMVLGALLERLLRDSYQIGLTEDMPSGSLDQQRMDFAKMMGLGESFRALLDLTLQAVLDATERTGILIPIDDPDLRPELVGVVLQHIRILAGAQQVVVVTCFSDEQVRSALAGGLMSSGGLTKEDAYRGADLHLIKTFPPYLRTALASLSLSERLAFTPPGRDIELAQILASIQVPDETVSGADNMLDLMWPTRLSNHAGRHNFLEALPENPRELVTLYFSLELSNKSHCAPGGKLVAASKTILAAGLSATRRRSPESKMKTENRIRIEGQLHSDKPLLTVDFTDFNVMTSRASATSVWRLANDVRIYLSTVHGVGAEGDEDAHFDSGVVSTMLLAQDISCLTNTFDYETEGGNPRFGGRGRGLMVLSIDGVRTDSEFITLPAWLSYGDVFAWDAAWRDFTGSLGSATAGHHTDPVGTPILIIAVHLDAILGLLRGRSVSIPAKEEIFAIQSDGSGELALDYLASVLERLRFACLAIPKSDPSERELLFLTWLDESFPQFLHSGLLTSEVARILMGARYEVLSPHLTEITSNLGARVERRIRSNLGESWIDGIMEFVHEGILPCDRIAELGKLHRSAKLQKESAVQLQVEVPGAAITVDTPTLGGADELIPRDPQIVGEALSLLLEKSKEG